LDPIEVHYMEKNPGMFSSKTLISFRLKKERHGHILKVNYSFNKQPISEDERGLA